MNHVVVGAGQVGRAIAEVLGEGTILRDVDDQPTGQPTDFLHIAFGWTPQFEAAVSVYDEEYRPRHLVIHSTVPVGTSRRLGATHSPVTGRHPNLAPSLRLFRKFVSGPRAGTVAEAFEAVGIETIVVPDQESTEAGKLWATLQYGWLIALEKEAYRFAQESGADPDVVYRQFNEMYNRGYAAMAERYVLPILEHMPGPIGGHCVIPNTGLTPGRLSDWLQELNDAW